MIGMHSRSGSRGFRGIDCRSIGTQNEYQHRDVEPPNLDSRDASPSSSFRIFFKRSRREIGGTPGHNPNTIDTFGGDRALIR